MNAPSQESGDRNQESAASRPSSLTPDSCLLTPDVWVGWVWDHATGDWLSVCHDREIALCHRELIRWAQVEGVPMRVTALTGGGRPTWTPKE